jgi:glycosyltransferase involved in cell wall biosynthesis
MTSEFVISNLPEVWRDWAGEEAGVILFIWDASRLGWFSRPNINCTDPSLKQFLTSAKIQRWIYNPVDAEGMFGKLTYPLIQSLLGFDRILGYGQFGENVMRESLGEDASRERDLSSIPHGIDSSVFYPRARHIARRDFFRLTGAANVTGKASPAVLDDEPLIGTVATNQFRKDYGLWAESCIQFLSYRPKARFWIHVDTMEREWSIPALLIDAGLMDKTAVSVGDIPDDHMAQAYSACDLTLGIGAGEGFGYPIAESLFCGTPCIHGNYAGAVDYLWDDLLINPAKLPLRGVYSGRRPVFEPKDWADKMESLLGKRVDRPNQLEWAEVWPRFESWFRRGLSRS